MPMYMDIHEIKGATADAVAKAHEADMKVQGKYGVEYHKYWVNESCGKIFCLCSAPTPGSGPCCSPTSWARPSSRNALATRRGWRSSRCTTASCATRCANWRAARSSTPATASWRASFFSAVAAARCATRIHRALAQHAQGASSAALRVRIGAAAGEPVEDHQDLFGSTVQLAARLCAHAQPEQSLVSNVVAELCIGKGLAFEDLGEVSLKGFERPVRVHAIQHAGG